MLSELKISEIFTTVYNTPLSYIIFYYLIVFSIASMIKHILNINVESLNSNLGIFKIDENSVPVLLLLGGFGLLVRFVRNLSIFNDITILYLVSTLILVILLTLIKEIQVFIQKKVLLIKKRKENYGKDEERLAYYAKETDSDYKFITISLLLIAFCLTFSFIEFGIFAMLSVLGLMICYTVLVISPKIKEIKYRLRGW